MPAFNDSAYTAAGLSRDYYRGVASLTFSDLTPNSSSGRGFPTTR